MHTSLFDYVLPADRIAQSSIEPRDHSRLLVLNRNNGTREHRHFFEIDNFLHPGDLLVVNESKVFKARLETMHHGHALEIFLLRPEDSGWLALARPAKKIGIGEDIIFAEHSDTTERRTATLRDKREDGTILIDFHATPEEVLEWTDRVGSVPVPPYVGTAPVSDTAYQTVYAKTIGSVAAPTAGFHFTPELIERLKQKGIQFATVTLHVGIGTFRPMKAETLEAHVMHEEWIDVPSETLSAIAETRAHGGRVIAVGTTTVRALESDMQHGFTRLFITPGYHFKHIDGLITNFHLPKSTLLVLVSAFLNDGHDDPDWGRQTLLAAYQDAIANEYRFYSFGDAMLIL